MMAPMLLFLLLWLCLGSTLEANPASDGGGADQGPDLLDLLQHLQGPELDMRSEESLSQMLVSMSLMQAISVSLGQPGASTSDLLQLVLKQGTDNTHELASRLAHALGPGLARLEHAGPEGDKMHLHLDVGALMDIPPEQLDKLLAAAAGALASPATQPSNHTAPDDGQHANQARSGGSDSPSSGPPQTTAMSSELHGAAAAPYSTEQAEGPWHASEQQPESLDMADAGMNHQAGSTADAGGGTQQRRLQAVGAIKTTDVPLRNGTVTVSTRSAADRWPALAQLADAKLAAAAARSGKLGSAINAILNVNWTALQDKVHEAIARGGDVLVNELPRIKAYNRLEQIFQIVVDKLTGGEGLGKGCTPYVFNGGGTRLPETIIFPSFSISKTTGNCVLIPEFIGNAEYPGQWSLVNSRIACLGPSSEYLLVPAFYRSAATAAESFACPTCRNEFSVGPAITVLLAGNEKQTIKFKNKAELLATLKTNKTFGWGRGGLDAALASLKHKVSARKEVLSKYFGGPAGAAGATHLKAGLLEQAATWVEQAWAQWQRSAAHELLQGKRSPARTLQGYEQQTHGPQASQAPEWAVNAEQLLHGLHRSLFEEGAAGAQDQQHPTQGRASGCPGCGSGRTTAQSEEWTSPHEAQGEDVPVRGQARSGAADGSQWKAHLDYLRKLGSTLATGEEE